MKVILVPVADRPECARALQAAFDLGERIGASVRGLHVRPHRRSNVMLSPAFADAAWHEKSTKRAPAAARALYEEIAAQHGYKVAKNACKAPCAIWSEKVGSPEMLLGIHGPLADLVVVSRPSEKGGVADMFLSSALTRSSRPVLVLPPRTRKRIGTRICIGWNQGKAAMLATKAAMPLLEQADEVTIVSCGREDKAGPKSRQLAAYLVHWGVPSKCVNTKGKDIEAELLAEYRHADADLLIGGAYSRSRWRERVFGGTTEYLVRRAKIPVLLRQV
jgi:nucleotide-binding universal stress UspA family protein